MKGIIAVTGAFILFIVVLGALWFGGMIFQEKTANFRGRVAVANQTKGNGSYRIAAYDHFYDACAQIQNDEAVLNAQKDSLKSADSDRKMQVEANIAALTGQRNSDINSYNADARKSGTEGQFRASDLPFHIDSTQENTTC